MEVQTFALSPFPFRVGRSPGLSLTLPRQTVSGVHAEFVQCDDTIVVRDLRSTNGTFVNGRRLHGEKALRVDDVVQFADAPFRVLEQSQNVPSNTYCKDAKDQALALVQFGRLLTGRNLVSSFQPIIDLKTQQILAYESLARSRVVGLETPDVMFSAAAELDSSEELSRLLRQVAVEQSSGFEQMPHLFLNTHPSELSTTELLESCFELRRMTPRQKITIEIHEGAITQLADMLALRRGLDEIDISLAFDDFGSGQARIAELAEVRPKYIKFDRSMIQSLDQADSSRRRLVRSLVLMVEDLGVIPLAEGAETEGEHLACLDLGFQLAQGYYYGRPMPASYHRSQAREHGTAIGMTPPEISPADNTRPSATT
ncbi:MAG: EAL domain-containing protein [Planctomycetaceae bacterium]|nr:EAL domain-containing protein [Planctomycetaceae bacterium]